MGLPRAIVIKGCTSCPHKHDWSSGGLCCSLKKDKVIVRGYNPRSEMDDKTPDWCPLPQVTGIVQNFSEE